MEPTEVINNPPPPFPNVNLSELMNKPKRPDPIKEKLIQKALQFQGDPTAEVSSKYKLTEEKDPKCQLEAEATGIKPEENLENKTQCPKCEKYVLNEEFQSHSNSHTSQILDWLFIGGEVNANNEKELRERDRIDVVFNTTEEVSNYFPEFLEYVNYHILDEVKQDLRPIFEDFSSKIAEYKLQKKRVLVHCIQGISRSVSLVISYLIAKEGMTLREAYYLVKDKRKLARPNRGFLKQLIDLEYKLTGASSLTIEDLYPPGTITFMSLNDKID